MRARRNRLLVEQAIPETDAARRPRPGGRARVRASRSVTVNLAESPLGWLKARGHLSARQFEAGERLRDDWERSRIERRTTMAWDGPPVGSAPRGAPVRADPTEAMIAAKLRLEAAVAAAGPGLADIIWRIVCAGEGMREAERALGWPARAGKLVLTLALDRLADHYRLR